MSNTKPNIYTNRSFNTEITDPDYLEVFSTDDTYDKLSSVYEQDPSNDNPNVSSTNMPTQSDKHGRQKIQISLWLLLLIIIFILIALVITGVVTFFITKERFSVTQYESKNECYWTAWSSWSGCSITCGKGEQVRVRQHMNTSMLCNYNETFNVRTCTSDPCFDESKNECYWTAWSSWSGCSITCGKGEQVRVRQHMNTSMLCNYNETFNVRTCTSDPCFGDDDISDMRFSRTYLYKNLFISADNTIISNVHIIDTSHSADAQLQNYWGTISDMCVGDNELMYYEVNYTYTIVNKISANKLVLEVGLAERSKVDRFYYVGNSNVSGWSFHLATGLDVDQVFLYSQDTDYRRVWESISNNIVGTKVHGKFILFINRRRNEFSLKQDESIFHVFKNVTSSVKLCPVFAVYGSVRVNVKLQLMNPRNFTYYPW